MADIDERLHALAARLGASEPATLTDVERRVTVIRRHRRTRRVVAAGVVLVVVAVTGVLVLARSTGHDRVSTATTPPPTAPAGISGDTALDVTWISATHGWALVHPAGCAHCTAIRTTTDGGTTWTALASPVASGESVSSIRFANANDGYLFGPDLFVTHDGGNTWTQEQSRPISYLEIAGSTAMRISYSHTGCPGPCDWSIDRAAVGSSDWQPLPIPAIDSNVSALLVRQGQRDVYASFGGNPAGGASNAQSQLLISHDGGDSWTSRVDPCGFTAGAENDTRGVAAAPGNVAVVLCQPRLADPATPGFVVVSSDGGATFGPPRTLPAGSVPLLLASLSASDIVVSTSEPSSASVLVTDDGGATWKVTAREQLTVQGAIPPGFLGFETATTGRWISPAGTLWTTTDGGQTWTPQHL